jgi:hypothetical protein
LVVFTKDLLLRRKFSTTFQEKHHFCRILIKVGKIVIKALTVKEKMSFLEIMIMVLIVPDHGEQGDQRVGQDHRLAVQEEVSERGGPEDAALRKDHDHDRSGSGAEPDSYNKT